MRGQHIQAADSVPNLHAGGGFAFEQHLAAGIGVLLVHGTEAGAQFAGPRVVDAFTLAHGIEGQDHVAELRQALAAPLVEIAALAVAGVAHLEQHSGMRGGAGLGQVEIGGDEEAGAALINHLLHPVGGALKRAGGAKIERRAPGQGADDLPERAARPGLIFADVSGGFQARDARAAAGVRFGRQSRKIIRKTAGVLAIANGCVRAGAEADGTCCQADRRAEKLPPCHSQLV